LDGPRISAQLAATGVDWLGVGDDGFWRPFAGHALELVPAAVLKSSPDPITRSRSVLDTSTSFGPASALTRAPMCTAIPPMSSPRTSHSPVCNPARTSMPSACTEIPNDDFSGTASDD